jgi:lipid-A-disaccharide synthase
MADTPLKIYFVLGEESGDALGADLLPYLKTQAEKLGRKVRLDGLAGDKLSAAGQKSLFDIDDIAVMGITAVVARLPTIIKRVKQTVADIVEKKPDVIVLIDSPDFTHAVAKRVRKQLPTVSIVNYVCPSVWAWRQSRAKSMRAYVDHVLAILPFEPKALADLGGPAATYVGHPLVQDISSTQSSLPSLSTKPVVLVLPGSRGSEVKRMLKPFGETLHILQRRGNEFQAVIPTVSRMRQRIELETANWPVRPMIVDSEDNEDTFAQAHVALATSGTVTLELALHNVPMTVAYILDPIATVFSSLIKIWSPSLPNLITDKLLVPEEFNKMVDPQRLARYLEELMENGAARKRQLAGFKEVAKTMKTEQPPGELAAEVILKHAMQQT